MYKLAQCFDDLILQRKHTSTAHEFFPVWLYLDFRIDGLSYSAAPNVSRTKFDFIVNVQSNTKNIWLCVCAWVNEIQIQLNQLRLKQLEENAKLQFAV